MPGCRKKSSSRALYRSWMKRAGCRCISPRCTPRFALSAKVGAPLRLRLRLRRDKSEIGAYWDVPGWVGDNMTLMRTSWIVSVATVAVLFLSRMPAGAGALDALYGVLDAQGLSYDRDLADAAAIKAATAMVDPRASLVVTDTNAVQSTNAAVLVVERWEQGIGYIRVPLLSDDISSNIVDQVTEWDADSVRGVILDLRGADGDSLAAVDHVAGLVATNGTYLYSVKSLQGEELERHTVQSALYCRAPLVVLTDSATSDGSEVLAAVLRKQGGVMLVGKPTRGDASVRRPHPLSEHLAVRIPFGKVCLGGSGNYDGNGVLPDVPVEEDWVAPTIDVSSEEGLNGRPLSEKALMDRELMKRIEADIALRRAADILLGLKALGDTRLTIPVQVEDMPPEDK